ncbi:MAG: hypothetical protein OEM62_11160 [Acidobacteriota bacterium]|nr:hypothetical protein [Acidobacteriota bacterium]
MRVSAMDALRRGVSNLLANWELVLVHLGQTVLVSVLFVAGAIPLVLVIGWGSLRTLWADWATATSAPPSLEDLLARLSGSLGPLLLGVCVALCAWTVALIVYAYVQAGIFDVLAKGEQGAPAVAGSRAGFRSFSFGQWKRSADRHIWHFFWLVNIFMALGTVLLVVLGLIFVATGWLVATEAVGAAFFFGCLGGSLLIVLAAGTSLWWQLAMAAAVSGASEVGRSIRFGGRVLVRRLGAVLVFVLLGVVIGITAAIVFLPGALLLEVTLRDSTAAYVSGQVAMSLLQSAFSSVLSVGFAAITISLVSSELRIEERGSS